MDSRLFLAKVKKLNHPKKKKYPKSFNIKLVFQELRRRHFYNKCTVTDNQFYAIIREVNQILADQLCKGLIVKLPFGLGSLETFKFDSPIKYEDGKLKVKRVIDWGETLKLWYNDKESYQNKTLIRREWKSMIKLEWNKLGCRCRNIIYFSFKPSRTLVHKINVLYRQGLLDTFSK